MLSCGPLENSIADLCPACRGGLLFPNGFLYAIGYAGLAATTGRQLFRHCWPAHRVNALAAEIPRLGWQADDCADSGVWRRNALVHILSSFNLLPVYQ